MKKRYIVAVILFLLPIAAVSLISIFDKDLTFSEKEKRELAKMPSLSTSDYLDASFMKGFESFYNDAFPAREKLMDITKNAKSVFYLSSFLSDDDAVVLPAAAAQNGVSADEEAQSTNGLLIYSNRLMEVFTNNDEKAKTYADTLNRLYEECGEPEAYVILPPPSFSLYAPKKSLTPKNDFDSALKLVSENLSGPTLIDITKDFTENKDDYLYFRTDHHWTARGAYLAARAYAKAAENVDLPPLSEYRSGKLEGFLGSLYNSIATEAISTKFEKDKDYVEYFYPENEAKVESFSTVDLSDPVEKPVIYENYDLDSNLYCVFFGGDIPIGHIKSKVSNGKSILVVRDSYGHAFVPYLIDLYEDIYLIEPRYFTAEYNLEMGKFFREKNIEKLLFLNYSNMAIGSYWTAIDTYLSYFFEK